MDVVVARLAATQRGVVTRAQAMEAGASARMIQRRLGSGLWLPVLRGVYAMPGAPDDPVRARWAAVLHAGDGCAISCHSAGRLHEFEEALDDGVLHLNVPEGKRHPPAGVRWHRQVDMADGDVVDLGGLPVTSIPRTAMDLAGDISITRLRRFVESAIVHRGFDPSEFGMVLGRVRRSGKHGVRRMERVLDDVGPGRDLPRSELERLLDVAIEIAGLPQPVHEHPLPGARDRPGFVDRCWPDVRWIVEGDGRRWHTRRQQIGIDYDRRTDAQAVGYQTTGFLWERLHGDPTGSADLLRRIYEQRIRETRHS